MALGFDISNVPIFNGMPMFGSFFAVFAVIGLALYVYASLALMAIAQKTKTENPWLAWIPFANLYLMTQIGKVPWWTLLIVVLTGFIPVVGVLVSLGIMVWWWWKIAEARHRPGWWGVLMLLPVVNLVLMGMLAWSK